MAIIAYTKAGKKAYRAKFEYLNRQHSQAGFTTQAKAREWIVLEKRRLEKEAGQTPQPEIQSLMYSDACAVYLQDCKARHQPGTVQEKLRHLTELAEFVGDDFPLDSLTVDAAREYIAHIQITTTNKTANRYLRTLKAFWNWTSRNKPLPPSPLSPIEPYPEDAAVRYIPPTEDVIAVLSAASQWERDFLSILTKTGARPGEVRALTWSDIDFSRSTITLWTRKRKGGEKQPRTINMSVKLAEELKRRFTERESETWVFLNPYSGNPLGRQDRPFKYMMERLCEAASTEEKQITPFTFYAFRHWVATRLRDSGKASRYEIQHILGHQRSDTTDIYLRNLAPDVKEAVSALDDAIQIEYEQKPPAKVIKLARA